MVCPNVTGRAKGRIAQKKRARAGSLALVDYIATRSANLYPPGVWLADAMTSFSGVTIVLFASLCFVFRLYAFFVEAAAFRSIVLRYAGAPR